MKMIVCLKKKKLQNSETQQVEVIENIFLFVVKKGKTMVHAKTSNYMFLIKTLPCSFYLGSILARVSEAIDPLLTPF